MSFVVTDDRKTLFKGLYHISNEQDATLSLCKLSEYELPEKVELLFETFNSPNFSHYELGLTPFISDLIGRLVIDWGGGELSYIQSFNVENPKKIKGIYPDPFFNQWIDYADVCLSHTQLCHLMKNPDIIWRQRLEMVNGIYLITNTQTRDHYVGSAKGEKGIWGRWGEYTLGKGGGNIDLYAHIVEDPSHLTYLQYSLLEVFPKGVAPLKIEKAEHRWMKKLCSYKSLNYDFTKG